MKKDNFQAKVVKTQTQVELMPVSIPCSQVWVTQPLLAETLETAKILNKTNYPKDGPEEKNIMDGQRRIS